jgi:hypothetical protein
MYRSRDIKEQADVLEKHYHSTAHFVDPLMNCKGTREILLAFYSLIKIFDTVQIEQLSAKLSTDPRLPPELASQNLEQVMHEFGSKLMNMGDHDLSEGSC